MTIDEFIKIHEYMKQEELNNDSELEEYLSHLETKLLDIDYRLSLICDQLHIDEDLNL